MVDGVVAEHGRSHGNYKWDLDSAAMRSRLRGRGRIRARRGPSSSARSSTIIAVVFPSSTTNNNVISMRAHRRRAAAAAEPTSALWTIDDARLMRRPVSALRGAVRRHRRRSRWKWNTTRSARYDNKCRRACRAARRRYARSDKYVSVGNIWAGRYERTNGAAGRTMDWSLPLHPRDHGRPALTDRDGRVG